MKTISWAILYREEIKVADSSPFKSYEANTPAPSETSRPPDCNILRDAEPDSHNQVISEIPNLQENIWDNKCLLF